MTEPTFESLGGLEKRIEELNNKATQLLLFLSFALVVAAILETQGNKFGPSQTMLLTLGMRFWAVAIFPILIGVLPAKEIRPDRDRWYPLVCRSKFWLLWVAIVCIIIGTIFFACAIWQAGQNQQTSESNAIQEGQVQQQNTQVLKAAEAQADQEIDIEGKLVKYTGWLVAVGALQFLVLMATAWALVGQIGTARNTERAWIMVDVEFGPEPGTIAELSDITGDKTSISFSCICRNQGKSPAWITERRSKFEIVESLNSLSPTPQLERTEILQDGFEPLAVERESKIKLELISAGRLDGKIGLLYGRIKYRDIFGRTRNTTFGYTVTLLNAGVGKRLERITKFPKYNGTPSSILQFGGGNFTPGGRLSDTLRDFRRAAAERPAAGRPGP